MKIECRGRDREIFNDRLYLYLRSLSFTQEEIMSINNWYALQTKPHKELFVIDQLIDAGIDYYYPALDSGRKPFFPGYLFVFVDMAALGANTLNHLRGARGLVQFGDWPEVVPADVIKDVKAAVAMYEARREKRIKQGTQVTITKGALAGYDGVFAGYSGKERVMVLLTQMQKRVTVAQSQVSLLAV